MRGEEDRDGGRALRGVDGHVLGTMDSFNLLQSMNRPPDIRMSFVHPAYPIRFVRQKYLKMPLLECSRYG